MDISSRLKHLEGLVFNLPSGDDLAGQWRELQVEYEAADPAHANLVDTLAKAIHTRSLARLVKGISKDPENLRLLVCLRKTLATFCRQRRYLIPGAKLIRVRNGNNAIVVGDVGRPLLQIMADLPIRSGGGAA